MAALWNEFGRLQRERADEICSESYGYGSGCSTIEGGGTLIMFESDGINDIFCKGRRYGLRAVPGRPNLNILVGYYDTGIINSKSVMAIGFI